MAASAASPESVAGAVLNTPPAPRGLLGLLGLLGLPRPRLSSLRGATVIYVAFTLALGAVGVARYTADQRALGATAKEDLLVIARLKARAIARWADERRADAVVLANDLAYDDDLRVWMAAGEPADARAELIRARLRSLDVYGDYRDAFLAAPNGRRLIGAHDGVAIKDPGLAGMVAEAARTGRVQFLHHDISPGGRTGGEVHICAPVIPPGGGPARAVVVLTVDNRLVLLPLMDWWPGASPTAETLVVSRMGDQAVAMNRPRHLAESAGPLHIPISGADALAPAARAAETVTAGPDYRGVPVFAAITPVRGTPWGVVAKVDQAEIDAPLRRITVLIMISIASLVGSTGLLLAGAWRRRQAALVARHIDAETRRRALAQRFEFLSRYANDVILLTDGEGRIVEVNERAESTYGLGRDALVGQAVERLFAADAPRPAAGGARRGATPGDSGAVFESEHRRADGSVFPVEISARDIVLEGASWRQLIVRDITDRKRAEAARSRLAAIVASSQDAVYSIDPEGLVTTWNQGAEQLYGWTAAEMIGGPISITVPEGGAYTPPGTSGQEAARFETIRRRRDGGLVQVSVSLSPIRAVDGGVVARSAIERDIGERKRAERLIRRSNRSLNTLSQANAALVGAASEQALYQRMCDILVETGGFRLACIGMAETDPGKTVRPIAWAGFERGFLDAHRITWADETLGRGPTGLAIRTGVTQINHAFDQEPNMAPWREAALERGYLSSISLPLHDRDGVFGVLVICASEVDAFGPDETLLLEELAGNLAFGIVTLRDRQARDRLAAIVESSREAIIGKDLDGVITSWNQGARAMYGYEPGEAIGWHIRLIVPQERSEEVDWIMSRIVSGESTGLFETERVRKDGGRIAVALQVSPTLDLTGVVIGASALGRDITDQKRIERDLTRAARFDSLTGLPNRGSLVESLRRLIPEARREEKVHAVLFMDLDHFKDINDTLGHPVGDQLLQQVAQRLADTVREGDMVARFGGDEFAIVCEDLDEPTTAGLLAQRVLAAVNQPFQIGGAEIRSGASLGIAMFGADAPDAETLLSWADIALYRAKAEGRGVYRFFTEAMDDEVRRRVNLGSELRGAIGSGQLTLAYQPQVESGTGRIIGLECLARWNHPLRGPIAPAEFVPISEQVGLAVPLGQWVMNEACRQVRAWLDDGLAPPTMAINVSGLYFRTADELERDLDETLQRFGLDATRLELELTETVLMGAAAGHSETLRRLRRKGFGLAIDDFGTGYSSLDYLRRFTVDRIKIDQNFVRDLDENPANEAIIRATVGLARALGLRVIAEGVETGRQRDRLKAWRCDEMQGHYFAPALPPAEIAELLRSGAALPI